MYDNNMPFRRWKKVQAYKHDGALHRQWSPAFLVEETDECWVLASKASMVTEADGRKWMTKERAIFILFKKRWMNVIAMFKEDRGICYYVNIASPTINDQGYLRYIDYDLDVKLTSDKQVRVLDEKEYEHHRLEYGYSDDLDFILKYQVKEISQKMRNGEYPFDDAKVTVNYNRLLDYFSKE